MEWDLEDAEVAVDPKNGMGERVNYYSDMECSCPNCDNVIRAALYVSEYPVGALEFAEIQDVDDSEKTNESEIETPVIAFFDL